MIEVVFERHSPSSGSEDTTSQLVRAFQGVFADAPWHEWKRCSKCDTHWGTEAQQELAQAGFMHCDVPVEDYWPTERVREDLEHEVGPESSCWIARDLNQVVGFCWGYGINTVSLEQKLEIPVADEIARRFGTDTVAYQDELGVLSEYRGRKIARELFLRRHEDFVAQGLTVGVVRTRMSPEPSVTFLWFTKKLGYEVVAQYPDGDGRVILARTFTDLEPLLR